MLKNCINKSSFSKLNSAVCIYLFFSIAILFIGRVIPLKNMIGSRIEGILYTLLAFIGIGLLLLDFIISRVWKRARYVWILYLFICVMGISSILNIKFGYIDNLKTMVWTSIQFGIFYTLYKRFDRGTLKQILWNLWKAISLFWGIPVCYSLWQFVNLEGKWIETSNTRLIRQGFIENRLFGIFNDPNHAAITSLCIIIAMLFMFEETKKRKYKILIIFNIILQSQYIVLSGSRTALVCAVVACCVYGCGKVVVSIKNIKIIKKIVLFFVVPVISVCFIAGTNSFVKNLCYQEIKIYANISGQEKSDASILKREDVNSENISNNRAAIWKAYIEGLKDDALFGGSPRNYLKKWIIKNPKGYLAETSYETHNGYLSVLMGTGIIGLLIIIMYIVLCIIEMLKYLTSNNVLEKEFVFSSMIIFVLLTYTFFFTELFFIHNVTAVLFWLHCGIMMSCFEK